MSDLTDEEPESMDIFEPSDIELARARRYLKQCRSGERGVYLQLFGEIAARFGHAMDRECLHGLMNLLINLDVISASSNEIVKTIAYDITNNWVRAQESGVIEVMNKICRSDRVYEDIKHGKERGASCYCFDCGHALAYPDQDCARCEHSLPP